MDVILASVKQGRMPVVSSDVSTNHKRGEELLGRQFTLPPEQQICQVWLLKLPDFTQQAGDDTIHRLWRLNV